MKIENKSGSGDYQILKNILGRNPYFLRKYINENLSKNQISELFPESVDKEEDEQPHNNSSPLKHLIITLPESEEGKGTEEMFFGRLASYTAAVLGLPQENVKIYSKRIFPGNEEIIQEFQEKEINLIYRDEILFFPLRSGIV